MTYQHTDELVACLSSHLSYCADGWMILKKLLSAGVPKEKIPYELPNCALKIQLLDKPNAWAAAQTTLEWCLKNKVSIIYPGHERYPEEFETLPQPPQFLTVLGTLDCLNGIGLSVVGARDHSVNALKWMEEHFLIALRHQNLFTISGGARGVDQIAHRLSLRAQRPTIAFLPSGLGNMYPADFPHWSEAIISGGGAVISEYPPMTMMEKSNFHRRNRMIAALGRGLFVVEAGRKSGSLITARFALELGKPICVLPASALEPRALGTLDLLFDGATPIRDAADLLTFLALAPSAAQRCDSRDQESHVGKPHSNDGRQLSLASEILDGNVHHPIENDECDAKNHSA
jgi:DNA processing protein